MFKKSDRTPADGAISIIGPGMAITGDVAFTGYLRVQGHVTGNITCSSDTQGTLVVHGAGQVTGSLRAPNIIVGGKVNGPLVASGAIEIHPGAAVCGDASYRQIEIHEGGTFEGTLHAIAAPEPAATQSTPAMATTVDTQTTPAINTSAAASTADTPRPSLLTEAPRITRSPAPSQRLLVSQAAAAFASRLQDFRHRLSLPKVAAIGAIGLGLFLLWPSKKPTLAPPAIATTPPLAAATEERTEPPRLDVPLSPPATTPAQSASSEATLAPEPPPATPEATGSNNATRNNGNENRIIAIEGTEWQKPAGFYFVTARETIILFQKRRGTDGSGRRIEVTRGAKKRFPISEQEVVRIAEGRNFDMYYQGRKLSTRVLESGAWLAFIAQEPPASAASSRAPTPAPASPPPAATVSAPR